MKFDKLVFLIKGALNWALPIFRTINRLNAFAMYWGIIIITLPLYCRLAYLEVSPGIGVPIDSRLIKDHFFLMCALGSLILFKNIPPKILSWLATFFIFTYGMFFLTALASGNAFIQCINFFVGLALLGQFITHLERPSTHTILINALAISTVTQSLWILAQYNRHQPIVYILGVPFKTLSPMVDGRAVMGPLNNTMVSGAALSMGLPFLWRRGWLIFLPLAMWSIMVLGSAMGAAGMAAGLGYMAAYSIAEPFIVVITGSLLLGWCFGMAHYFPAFFDGSHRFEAWIEILKAVKITWLGNGPGFMEDYGPSIVTVISNMNNPHNEFVQAYITWGIVGCVIFAIAFALAWRGRKKNPTFQASLLAGLAASIGSFPFYISSSALVFIVDLAVLLRGGIYGNEYSYHPLDITDIVGRDGHLEK